MYASPSSPPCECTPLLRDRAPGRSDNVNQNVSVGSVWRTGKNSAGLLSAESTAVEFEKLQTVKDVVHTMQGHSSRAGNRQTDCLRQVDSRLRFSGPTSRVVPPPSSLAFIHPPGLDLMRLRKNDAVVDVEFTDVRLSTVLAARDWTGSSRTRPRRVLDRTRVAALVSDGDRAVGVPVERLERACTRPRGARRNYGVFTNATAAACATGCCDPVGVR